MINKRKSTSIKNLKRSSLTLYLIVAAVLIGAYIFTSCHDNGDGQFILYTPLSSTETYLIDTDNNVFHTWSSEFEAGQSAYLQNDGSNVRAGAINDIAPDNTFVTAWNTGTTPLPFNVGGIVERISKNNELLWTIKYFSDEFAPHHDVIVMPNGNLLMPVWRAFSEEEAIEMGRNPDLVDEDGLWIDSIVEIEVLGDGVFNIVWEWFASDHLVQDFDPDMENFGNVAANPELININYDDGSAFLDEDLMHSNSVVYIEEFDQIILTVFNYSEFWVIDHSTTTEEAAGHTGGRYGRGGDILYRWGNPSAYDRGNADVFNLSGVHDANWVSEEGYFIMFDNNNKNEDRNIEGGNSMLVMIKPPILPDGSYEFGTDGVFGPADPLIATDLSFEESALGTAIRFSDGRFFSCDCISAEAVFLDRSGNVEKTRDVSENTGEDGTPSFRLTPYRSNSQAVDSLR
jgi:hypothetical protein